MDVIKLPTRTTVRILDGAANHAESQEYMKQIEKDSQRKKEHMSIQKIWEEAEHAKIFGKLDALSDWQNVRSRITKNMVTGSKRIPAFAFIMRIAAVVILAMGLTFVFYKVLTTQQSINVGLYSHQAESSVEEFTMPDGSVVSLNVGSSLTYREDFNIISRDVILQGEGLFDVVSDLDMPFRVYTGGSLVEVTGTTFSIYEDEGTIKVAVMEGTVTLSPVDDASKKIDIGINQSGYLFPNKELKIAEGINANNLSWKTGLLVFDETPLDSALFDIAHYFRKDLSIETEIPERVTAEFENQPLGEILGELEQVAGLVFDTTGGSLIVRR